MNYENYFIDLLESIEDYRKTVLLLFLFQNDKNLIKEIGFSKNVIILLNLEFKNTLIEKNEEYLDYIKNKEESIIERILNK